DALEVEHGQAAELADDAGRPGRHHAVHRRGQQRQLEAVVAELPGDVDVVRVACPAGRNNRDIVESVGAAGLLPAADLYFHWTILGLEADETAAPFRLSNGRARPRRATRT